MILAFNKTRNARVTYENITQLNEAKQWHDIEIIDSKYSEFKDEEEYKEI